MPSFSASLVITKLEPYIGRKITLEERLFVEEMVLNYYAGAISKFIEASFKQEAPRCFDYIYASVMAGKLWGARRGISKLSPGLFFAHIYERIDRQSDRDFSDRELMDLYNISHRFSEEEFEHAFKQAAARHIFHPSYILAIAERTRYDRLKGTDRRNKAESIPIGGPREN